MKIEEKSCRVLKSTNADSKFNMAFSVNLYRTLGGKSTIYVHKMKQDGENTRWRKMPAPRICHNSKEAISYLTNLIERWERENGNKEH